LTAQLSKLGPVKINPLQYEGDLGWRLEIIRSKHGIGHTSYLDYNFVEGGDYDQLRRTAEILAACCCPAPKSVAAKPARRLTTSSRRSTGC
jgi:hypothetical protein